MRKHLLDREVAVVPIAYDIVCQNFRGTHFVKLLLGGRLRSQPSHQRFARVAVRGCHRACCSEAVGSPDTIRDTVCVTSFIAVPAKKQRPDYSIVRNDLLNADARQQEQLELQFSTPHTRVSEMSVYR